MNLEELLRRERDVVPPNPLVDRADQIVSRIRRRRRARVAGAAAAVGSVAALAVLAVVVGQLFPKATAPAEPSPTTTFWTLPMDDGETPLEPGSYVFPVMDTLRWPTTLPVVSVPAGYAATEDAAGVEVGTGNDADRRMLRIWEIYSVYSHPCDAIRRTLKVGPTAADLADALAAQPMRDGTTPVPVTIGGYDGFYVELSVPDDIDVDACPGGKFFSWPGRWQQGAGQVDMLWVVDVDGQRVVFDAWAMPGVSPQERAELQHMVTTATFVPTVDR
ncbi:hypothetical protein [Cellulomonas sp. P5_E12]